VAHILILEDDYLFRQSLENLFAQFDHTFESAESAEEAVAKANQSRFDLLLSDVRIAGEVDGVEAVSMVRKILPNIRCILMTGYADVDAPLRAASVSADDYLLKPFKMQALLQSLRTVLEFEPARSNFLTRLGEAPGKAAARALRWFYDAHLQQLEELREQSMRQFFILVRSKRLKCQEAQAYFAAWEQLELDYLSNQAPGHWSRLIPLYHHWGKQLVALEQPDGCSEHISPQAFELIHARMMSGTLEVAHLLKSIQLLHYPESRKLSLENFCTYHWLWGKSSDQGDPFLGVTIKGYRLTRQHSGGDSSARIYEAEADYMPDRGDRILCLPEAPESRALIGREVDTQRARLLASLHGHHFLLYPSYSMSLKARLPGNGMEAWEAWRLLKPVFLQVVAFHKQGKVSGCFSLRDIDSPPGQPCLLSHFSDAAYRDAHRVILEGEGRVMEFFSAPEVIHQALPTPLSDQAVLGRLLFEVVYGGRYPDHNLRVHIRMLGKSESNRAFAPFVQRLGPMKQIFYQLAHSDPSQRFPSLEAAIELLDKTF
jgi:CheY-like chemotaxis protein